jgi:hypothetical protein
MCGNNLDETCKSDILVDEIGNGGERDGCVGVETWLGRASPFEAHKNWVMGA